MEKPRADLVVKAACSSCSNTFEWLDDDAQRRVIERSGLKPRYVRDQARRWIRAYGEDVVEPRKERDEEYLHVHEWWYKVVIKDLPEYPRGLFVKMQVHEPIDEDEPVVELLGAHD